MRAFTKSHPLIAYYALTFAISWGGVLLVIGGPSHLPGTPQEGARLLPYAVIALVLGPTVAGILLTYVVDGGAGLREFRARLFRWRVGVRWYAVALLTTPVLAGATLYALLPTSTAFRPGIVTADDRPALLLTALGAGLFAGVFEETGWTGFAIPRLRLAYCALETGLIVGVLWGVWHYIAAWWGSGSESRAFLPSLFVAQMTFYVLVLPAYRVLMVWVYDATNSLLVAMLMHASLTGNVLFVLMPRTIAALQLVAWYASFAGALWVCVGVVAARPKTI
jgi:hypothetical protein